MANAKLPEVALIPAAWLFGLYAIYLLISVAASAGGELAVTVLMGMQVAFGLGLVLWSHSIYRISNSSVGAAPKHDWLFILSMALFGLLIPLIFVYLYFYNATVPLDAPVSRVFVTATKFTVIGAVLSLFATAYLASRALVSAERQLDSRRTPDASGVFVMILFFPIGVWMISPRVQKVYHQKSVVTGGIA